MTCKTSINPLAILARTVARQLPAWPAAAAVALVLNKELASRLDDDVSERIRKKIICITVRDAAFSIVLFYDGRSFVPVRASSIADVTITANARDFLRLATREEDPDTLFFSRRLTIEGDTEAGLTLKNALDALASEQFLLPLEPPLRTLPKLRTLFPTLGSDERILDRGIGLRR